MIESPNLLNIIMANNLYNRGRPYSTDWISSHKQRKIQSAALVIIWIQFINFRLYRNFKHKEDQELIEKAKFSRFAP
jgi:hypothetical protein